MIDAKPFIGDPAFDPVQHMLNCEQRLANEPERLAGLLILVAGAVVCWATGANCVRRDLHRSGSR